MRYCLTVFVLAGLWGIIPTQANAFPIDAAGETGIMRLEGYRLAQLGKVPGNRLPRGARLKSAQIQLRLLHQPDFVLPAPDAAFTRQVVQLLGEEADNYSINVLDLSDPGHVHYAEHFPTTTRNPASVGKVLVALAVFQALADLYPDDIAARQRLLKTARITADEFIISDHHAVPFWLPESMRLLKRRLAEGDSANFWTYLDWSLSASSNAATSMVIKHLMLLRHFGHDYPVDAETARSYFLHTPKSRLHDELMQALLEPVSRQGFDTDRCRQGSFFTRTGKAMVPGTNSLCTTRDLMMFLVRMEQGKLVDAWSSLQLKRLLYLTRRRIRYASSPALEDAAVYFKSGSFYRCRVEPGFVCRQYQGNVLNLMNSIAIIEHPAGAPHLYYMVTLTSNVLRKNSAVAHQTLATRLHALLERLHPVRAKSQ